jgi:glycosyltransferase involved in cell wall biosynthesis
MKAAVAVPERRFLAEERRLRVAIISDEGHPDYDLAFASAVARRADVLFCGPAGVTDDELEAVAPARALRLSWPRHRSVIGNLRLLARLATTVRRFTPDVVHVLSEGQVWLNLLPILLWPIPMVVTLHDVRIHPGDRDTARVPRRLVELFVRQAKAVLVHGDHLKADAAAHLGLSPDRVFTGVHPTIDKYAKRAKALGCRAPGDGVFRILFFGRVFPYKGVDHLLAAEPLIGEDVTPRVTIIAGRGDAVAHPAERSARASRIDVRSRAIPDDEAAELFAAADIVVLPYIEASQSGVLAIAAAFGAPVVASDVGDLGAMVAKTGMGLLIPPADPEALARAITRMARDPAFRATCAAKSLQAGEEAMGPDVVWRLAEAAYRSVLRSERQSV